MKADGGFVWVMAYSDDDGHESPTDSRRGAGRGDLWSYKTVDGRFVFRLEHSRDDDDELFSRYVAKANLSHVLIRKKTICVFGKSPRFFYLAQYRRTHECWTAGDGLPL